MLLSKVYTSTGAEARITTRKKRIMSMKFEKNILKNHVIKFSVLQITQ